MYADLQGRVSILDSRRTVFLGHREDTQDATNARFSFPLMDRVTQCPDLGSRSTRSPQQLRRTERHSLGVVFVFDPIPTTFLAEMLAQQLPGSGMPNPHVECIPLHFDQP